MRVDMERREKGLKVSPLKWPQKGANKTSKDEKKNVNPFAVHSNDTKAKNETKPPEPIHNLTKELNVASEEEPKISATKLKEMASVQKSLNPLGTRSRFKDDEEYVPPKGKSFQLTPQQKAKKEAYEKEMKKLAELRAKKVLERENEQFNKVYSTKGQDKYEVRVSIEHLKKAATRGEQALMAFELLIGIILLLGIVATIFWLTKKKRKRLADEENTPLRSEKSK